jgi:hypothetical protein
MRPSELLTEARDQVAELTGKTIESVSGLERDGDEDWVVSVEVLELERVPNTMDLLATYEVRLDGDGELLGFRRRRRYHRAAEDDEG